MNSTVCSVLRIVLIQILVMVVQHFVNVDVIKNPVKMGSCTNYLNKERGKGEGGRGKGEGGRGKGAIVIV